ncbi:MoaD/ThiS family protein [Rhodothermus marinus]|uniref:MoaD/ThiS family protein n=1 Tax=Rhodothermus marinus TaxID=29549 RepID=UPI000A683AAD|nr:MoaD/ThiS family protein [Rhodothermus marinus]
MSDAPQVRLRVLLFSTLRERLGSCELEVFVPAPATGSRLLDQLAAQYPAIAAYRPVVRLAVNQEYVPESVELHENDEIA